MSRDELQDRFAALDRRMLALRRNTAPDLALWRAIGQELPDPRYAVSPDDRQWWWRQLISLLAHYELSAEPQWLG